MIKDKKGMNIIHQEVLNPQTFQNGVSVKGGSRENQIKKKTSPKCQKASSYSSNLSKMRNFAKLVTVTLEMVTVKKMSV